MTIVFTSGIQLLSLGIIGEYIGQILDEVKGWPIYLIRQTVQGGKATAAARSGVKTLGEPLPCLEETR